MNQNQYLANIIMEYEQKSIPYFNVTEIDIIESTDIKVKYKIKISSKYDSKWYMWEPTHEINLSKLITESRDQKLKLILED